MVSILNKIIIRSGKDVIKCAIKKSGFLKVRIDGEIQDIENNMQLDRYKTHDIEIVIDYLTPIEIKAIKKICRYIPESLGIKLFARFVSF